MVLILQDSYFWTLVFDLGTGLFVDVLVFLFVMVRAPFVLVTVFADYDLPVFDHDNVFHFIYSCMGKQMKELE